MFQDKYELFSIKNLLQNLTEILIVGNRTDERSVYIKNNFTGFNGKTVFLSTDQQYDKINIEVLNNANGEIQRFNNLILLQELSVFLRKDLELEQKNVLVDITGLNHVILFLLVKILLTEISPKSLFVGYTEPKKYLQEDSDLESFNLSEHFLGVGEKSVPGFSKWDRGKEKVLVALLGFEGHRLNFLIEGIQPAPKCIIPVVGFPSYMPGWETIAIIKNSRAINSYDCLGEMRTCEASSPVKLYDLLLNLAKSFEGLELLIAPIGTRPHALGAAIFVSLNSNCKLVYDFPTEKEVRSIGILKANIYHLSKYIHS